MSEIVEKTKVNMWEFRMAIAYFILFSIGALCTAIMASLVNSDWSAMNTQSKFLMFVAIIGSWVNTIMAFVSKQAGRIKKTGEFFPDLGDTQSFVKQTTDVHVTSQSPPVTPSQPVSPTLR